ncbi:MAG: poly-gamma-glutamate hydrolase family protein [Actinomycetota bacterium]
MQEVNREPITFSGLLAKPGVLEIVDLRSRFGFCAFHGGNLERVTDQIASEAAARSGSSFYGVVQPPGMRHHIPSAQVSPDQSPDLKSFIEHCEVVVAIHGYGRRGFFTSLLFGGGNRELAAHVATNVRASIPPYEVVDDINRIPKALRGLHPDNPCNLPVNGGVQLELPPRVRGLSPLAAFWPSNPRGRKDWGVKRFPHVDQLIQGLVDAALSWPTSETTP